MEACDAAAILADEGPKGMRLVAVCRLDTTEAIRLFNNAVCEGVPSVLREGHALVLHLNTAVVSIVHIRLPRASRKLIQRRLILEIPCHSSPIAGRVFAQLLVSSGIERIGCPPSGRKPVD